ncbi:MAG: hypothetical protein ABIE81_04115 [Candidatus Omnitrophota bacterium]
MKKKEITILRYFGPTFLLALGLVLLFRTLIWSPIIILSFRIICSIAVISFLILTFQTSKILRKYGKVKLPPIFWLIFSLIPVSNLITPFVLWFKTSRLLELNKKQ